MLTPNHAGLPQAIGTTTDLQDAATILIANFSGIAGSAAAGSHASTGISQADLLQAASGAPSGPRDAAMFFLESPADVQLAGQAGAISVSGLQGVLRTEANGQLQQALVGLAQGSGADTATQNRAYADLLRDPGVPDTIRAAILATLPDARLSDIVGRPITTGTAQDAAAETGAFLGLAKTSWLGAAEAESLARYKVTFAMDRGAQDKGYSFWDGSRIHISEKMVNAGQPGYISEVLAHEGGHAIFQLSGLQARMAKDVAKLTPHIEDIVNEGFAGVFGNRAHVALFGPGDATAERHLAIATDVGDSLVDDNTFYAKYYHVDTAAARAEIGSIHQIMSNDLLPFFNGLGLAGDPNLAAGLPARQ